MRIVNKAPFRNTQKVFKNNLNKFRPNLVAYKISPRAEPIGKGKNLHSKGLNFVLKSSEGKIDHSAVTFGQKFFRRKCERQTIWFVGAQLAVRLLPMQEVRCSNPIISKICIEDYFLSSVLKRRK